MLSPSAFDADPPMPAATGPPPRASDVLRSAREQAELAEATFSPRINRSSQKLQRTPTQLAAWEQARQERLARARQAASEKAAAETFTFTPKTNPLKSPLPVANVFERLTKPSSANSLSSSTQASPAKSSPDKGTPPVKSPEKGTPQSKVHDLENMYSKGQEFLQNKEAARIRIIEEEHAKTLVHATPRNRQLAARSWIRRARDAFEQCPGFQDNSIPASEFEIAVKSMGIYRAGERDKPPAIFEQIKAAIAQSDDADSRLLLTKFSALLERALTATDDDDYFAKQVTLVLAEGISPTVNRSVSPPRSAPVFTPQSLRRLHDESLQKQREHLEEARRAVEAVTLRELTFAPKLISSSRVPPPPRTAPVHVDLYALAKQSEVTRRLKAEEHQRQQLIKEQAACSFSPRINPGPPKLGQTPPPPMTDVHVARQRAARKFREEENERLAKLGTLAPTPALVVEVFLGSEQDGPKRVEVFATDTPDALSEAFCRRHGINDAQAQHQLEKHIRDAMRSNGLLPEQKDGWELHFDNESGRWFFHHPDTMASSWTRPPSCPDPSQLPLCVPVGSGRRMVEERDE